MSETLPFSGMAIYFPANERQEGVDEPEKDKNVDPDVDPEYVRVDADVSIPYEVGSIEPDGSAVFKTLNMSRVTRGNKTKDQITQGIESSKKEEVSADKSNVKGVEDSEENKKPKHKKRLGCIGRVGIKTLSVSGFSGAAILFGPVKRQNPEQSQEENPEKKSSGETENYINRLQEMIAVPYRFTSDPDNPDSLEIEAALLEISDSGTICGTLGNIACRFDERGNVSGEIIPRKPRKKTSGSVGKPQIA